MRFNPLFASLLVSISGAIASRRFDQNLVYRSPILAAPELGHDTAALHERFVRHSRRQLQSPKGFKDEHYPTFYGSNMANAPFVWNGGINFTHSVASGDPLDDSVLLWTRAVPVSPQGSSSLPDQSVPVCVSYKISTSQDIARSHSDSGEAYTSYDVDWTVKVEPKNLRSDTIYYFQFADCTNPTTVSPIGRTRTLPDNNTPANRVNGGKGINLAVFSCSQYQAGYFNAYGYAAHNTTADIFVHLGDYIYEGVGNGRPIGRQVLGRELATIADYRLRLNQYRTDQHLSFAHQYAPWITVWVSVIKHLYIPVHEHNPSVRMIMNCDQVANNAWNAGTSNSNDSAAGCTFSTSGACYTDRKFAAVRAYHEWMPIRVVDPDDQLRIWRNFQIGKLFDLTMLDTRHYDRDVTDLGYNKHVSTLVDIDNRSLMGKYQEKWLNDTLLASKRRGSLWRIIGQQIVFTQVNQSGSYSVDNWSGYHANRQRILNHLYANKIDNAIILAGDSHANWVSDLAHPNDTKTYDPVSGKGAIGVEFAGTAVTSGASITTGTGTAPAIADARSKLYVQYNPPLQWSEGSFRGFFTLQLTTKSAIATYYGMQNLTFSNLDAKEIAKFVVIPGANKLQRPVAGGNVTAGVLKSQVPLGI